MLVGVIVDESYAADLQRVVDVVDIGLNVAGGLFQQRAVFLLPVVTFHHLRDVPPGGNEAQRPPLFVAHSVHSRLVVELTADGQFRNPLVVMLHLVDVGHRRQLRLIQMFQVELPIRWYIPYIHVSFHQFLPVFDAKGLAGFLVDVRQPTVCIIIDHVDQRRVERGVELYCQIAGFLFPSCVFRDVALDTEQHLCFAVTVAV